MSFYRRYPTKLPPQPFTGMLAVVDEHATHHECTVSSYVKLGLTVPEEEVRRVRAMRAVERILAGTERFWDSAPPAAMSIKEMIARHEEIFKPSEPRLPTTATNQGPTSQPASPTPVKAAASLFGGDGE